MAINLSTQLYAPVYDFWARPITVFPVGSQPGMPPYNARGIFDTKAVDVVGEDGSIVSDTVTILDIREAEFSVLPAQLDRINIPASGAGPSQGDWEVTDTAPNAGGETTLSLRQLADPEPYTVETP